MPSYALLQINLEQTLDRNTLEEASVHAPSVARADCARIHNDLFGIVVNGLPYEEAVAFQVALEHFGFPTEIVPDDDLPALVPPKFRRGIRIHQAGFTAIDGLGREDGYPWAEVQFASGGFVQTVVHKSTSSLEWRYSRGWTAMSGFQTRKKEETHEEKEFRLELFLSCEPYRLQFRAGKETLFRFNEYMLRSQQEDQFLELLRRVGQIFPANCLGLGIHAALRSEHFRYPSVSSFDEETIWHLYHRLRG